MSSDNSPENDINQKKESMIIEGEEKIKKKEEKDEPNIIGHNNSKKIINHYKMI